MISNVLLEIRPPKSSFLQKVMFSSHLIPVAVAFLLIANGAFSFLHSGSKARPRCIVKPKLDLNDKNLQEYLKGPEGKPWKGSRSTLERRGQV
jgi:hypothetical protein